MPFEHDLLVRPVRFFTHLALFVFQAFFLPG